MLDPVEDKNPFWGESITVAEKYLRTILNSCSGNDYELGNMALDVIVQYNRNAWARLKELRDFIEKHTTWSK